MSFPNHTDKYSDASLLTPEDIVAYRRHLNRLPKMDTPNGVLFCLEKGLPKRMRWRVPARKVGSMLGDLYQVKQARYPTMVMSNFGGGAPIVVELAEELIALGARRLILLTWGGSLQPGLKAGDIVVCDRAIRDEGVSHHYLPATRYVPACARLCDRLVEALQGRGTGCKVGATWTTDAPFRETLREVEEYQREGVMTVEMESAGLFALGQVREVETASIVVVMDSLANLRWEAPARLEEVSRSLKAAYVAAVDVLRNA